MTLELRVTHASGDTFMSERRTLEDVERLVTGLVDGEPRDLVTLTETAEPETRQLINKLLRGHPYLAVHPAAGDVTFLVSDRLHITDAGGRLAVAGVAGPASLGGHGPRYNSWVKLAVDGEVWYHVGCHLVTAKPTEPRRRTQQITQLGMMGEMLARFGRGRAIATGSGDLNAELPNRDSMQAVFDRFGLETTAHETGNATPTHGTARLDYIWTRKGDGRVTVDGMHVRRGPQWNSDHDPVDATLSVRA